MLQIEKGIIVMGQHETTVVKRKSRTESPINPNDNKGQVKRENQSFGLRQQELETFLKSRKIQYLVHFTRIENLNSIIEHGLIPVQQLKTNNIKHIYNDRCRFEHQHNCTSVSVEYPNFWLLRSFRNKKPDSRWVIIVLDVALLFDHDCYFAEYNAASAGISANLEERKTVKAFRDMFKKEILVVLSKTVRTFNRSYLKNNRKCYPTSDQAEILVEGNIQREYIKCIYFMCDEDAERYKLPLEHEGIRWVVERAPFNTKRDLYKGLIGR